MKKNIVYKVIAAAVFLVLTILFFIIPENGAIAPSAMVAFFLTLTFIGADNVSESAGGKAARFSIITFSILVIALNVLITIILPAVSNATDLSSMSVELTTSIGSDDASSVSNHFVEVMLNDAHELCYATVLLLLINSISAFLFRIKMAKKIKKT